MFTNIILKDLYDTKNFLFYKGGLFGLKNNMPLKEIDSEHLESPGIWRCNYLTNEKDLAWIGFERKGNIQN